MHSTSIGLERVTNTGKTDFSDFAGRWVTVNGRRIFIKDGETPNEAFDRTFFGKKKPKSPEPKKKRKG